MNDETASTFSFIARASVPSAKSVAGPSEPELTHYSAVIAIPEVMGKSSVESALAALVRLYQLKSHPSNAVSIERRQFSLQQFFRLSH